MESGTRVLVTGGAGFIGSHLVDRLLAAGHEVVCVDNLSLGSRDNLAAALTHPRFAMHVLDVANLADLERLFAAEKPDMVYHLAANSDIREGTRRTDRDLTDTFLTTYNVVESMRRTGVRRILFASTGAIFGEKQGAISEDDPAFPESLYGASKLASEAFISAYCNLYEITAYVCRFPNVVGPRATHGILYDLRNKLAADPPELEVLGDGTQAKPYMHVRDLVDAFLFIRDRADAQLNVFNIGPADTARVSEIARIVLGAWGNGQPIAYTGGRAGWKGDVPEYRYDASRLRRLGWEPQLTSDEAIRLAVSDMTTA